jgi:hypothetical protein
MDRNQAAGAHVYHFNRTDLLGLGRAHGFVHCRADGDLVGRADGRGYVVQSFTKSFGPNGCRATAK